MVDFQKQLELLIAQITELLSLAQLAGRVERYRIEVVFVKQTDFSSQNKMHDLDVCETLYCILKTVEEIVARCYITTNYSRDIICPDEGESSSSKFTSKSGNRNQGKQSYNVNIENIPIDNDAFIPTDSVKFQKPQNDYCLTRLGQSDYSQAERINCLSPQHPTTKETEAANVLMNLSGKAAERVSHARVDDSLHPQEILSLEGKSTTGLHTALSNCRWESQMKRDHCSEEVPQINEKDLLSLTSQVLCQFCSRQCEDLVELHEHVLAMHHVPESEFPVMPPVKKFKTAEIEDSNHMQSSCSGERENMTEHVDPEKPSPPFVYMENQQIMSKMSMKKIDAHRENFQESTCDGHPANSVENQQNITYKDDIIHNLPNVIIHNLEPMEHQPQTFSIGRENENEMHQQAGQFENGKQSQILDSTDNNPIESDALAIAVESSQIKDIEAKVIVYVCLKCSSSYTHSQEYDSHVCCEKPFIQTAADGSVTLTGSVDATDNLLRLPEAEFWYFPEFFIRQTSEGLKLKQQIVHFSTGRILQLHTNCQMSYLSEQFISFRCPICKLDYDSLSRFLDHLVTGPCMFRCPECNRVYINQEKLQNHRESLHPGIEDRTCPNCHMVFEKRHQRNKHLKTKCSISHVCDICGSVLKNAYNLQVHMQTHQEKRHICKLCGSAFHRRAILQRHMMHHTGTRRYPCMQCSAKFYTRQHLNSHMDRHNCIKRFECASCDKAYYSKHDLSCHITKIHAKPSEGHTDAPEEKEEDGEKIINKVAE